MKNFGSMALIKWVLAFAILAQNTQNRHVLRGTATQDGHPIGDAVVSVYLLTSDGYAKSVVATTNNEGVYRIPDLGEGRYALLLTKAGSRIYQGLVEIGPQPEVFKDIAISTDPFTGRWKLLLDKSTLPVTWNYREEMRTYSKKGEVIEVLIELIYHGRHTQYKEELVCNGTPNKIYDNRTLTCIYKSPTVVDTEESPPKQSARWEVTGGVLKITVFKDANRLKPKYVYVFAKTE